MNRKLNGYRNKILQSTVVFFYLLLFNGVMRVIFKGEKIREARKSKKITQGELGKDLGISQQYLSKIEQNDVINPNFLTIVRITEILEIDIKKLYEIRKD